MVRHTYLGIGRLSLVKMSTIPQKWFIVLIVIPIQTPARFSVDIRKAHFKTQDNRILLSSR